VVLTPNSTTDERDTQWKLRYFHNVKGKVVPVHTMKAYRGRKGKVPLIRNLGTGWRRVTFITIVLLYFYYVIYIVNNQCIVMCHIRGQGVPVPSAECI
jgi:hypothetical protein